MIAYNEFSAFLEIIIKAAIGIAVPLLVGFAVQFFYSKQSELKLALGEQRFNALQTGLTFVLQAAKQAGLAGIIANEATAKKEYAVESMQAFLKGYGLTMDVKAIEAAIEAAFLQGLQNPENTPPLIPPPVVTVNALAATTKTTTTTETPAAATSTYDAYATPREGVLVTNSQEPQPMKDVMKAFVDAKKIEAHPNADG